MAEFSLIVVTIVIFIGWGVLLYLISVNFSSAEKFVTPERARKIERLMMDLDEYVGKSGARNIRVEHIGAKSAFLEHFMIRYHDNESSWQTRHVLRQVIPDPMGGRSKQVRYYWDDPVVIYEREVSAEISQSKQELINDLDLEIHQLRQAIATHANPEK